MKVLGFNCGRKNGNTEILMKEAFKVIEEKTGAECEIIRLQDAEIKSCTGCETCVMKHLAGDPEFRCVHDRNSDHLYFIEQKMREADAIIVSAPAYNMLPPGILVRFLNRLHGTGDYSEIYEKNPKIGATFTIGGSDWTNYTMPIANLITSYATGSFETIVDKCHFDFLPAPAAVVLEGDILDRIHLLGERVAQALNDKANGIKASYKGDSGVCPDCQGTFLEKRSDGWYCPQCLSKASFAVENGELKVTFTEEARSINRCTPVGNEIHVSNIQRCHKKAAENRDLINAQRNEYNSYGHICELPQIVK